MESLHLQGGENTSDMMLPYTLDMLQEELSQLSAIQKRSETDRTRPVLSRMNAEVPGLWWSQYETIPIEMLPPTLFQVPNSLGGGIPIESHNFAYDYPPVAPKSDEGQPTAEVHMMARSLMAKAGNPESSHDGPSWTNIQPQGRPNRSSAPILSTFMNNVNPEDSEIMVGTPSSFTPQPPTAPAFGPRAAAISPSCLSPFLSPPFLPNPQTPVPMIPAASATHEKTSKEKRKTVVRSAFATELPPDVQMLNFPPEEVMRPVTDDDIRVFKPWSADAGRSPFEPFYPPLRLEAVPSHHPTNPLKNVDFQQYDIPQLYLTPQEYSRSKVLQSDNEFQAHTRSERTEQQAPSGPSVPTLGSLGRVPVDGTPHITPFRGPISPVATLPMSSPSPTPVRQEQHQGVPDQTPRQPQVEFVPEGMIPPSPSSSPGTAHPREDSPQGFQPLQRQVDAPATGTPRTHRVPQYSEAPHTGFLLQPSTTSPTTVVSPAVSVPSGQTIDIQAVLQPQQPQLNVGEIREMLDLLRRNDRAQKIALDQQREVIRYLGDLNGWLERDAYDRQTDMTSLAAGLVSLPDEVAQRRPLLF
ncbi:hypothetical protein FRC00_007443 [Tulasnella sp. 408]|nr:hypothetical protein FRC00_007443 [Tulasnella sp. 408]